MLCVLASFRFSRYEPSQKKLLPGGVLNAARVDVARLEDRFLLGPKVLAHHGDHAHIGEETGGQ